VRRGLVACECRVNFWFYTVVFTDVSTYIATTQQHFQHSWSWRRCTVPVLPRSAKRPRHTSSPFLVGPTCHYYYYPKLSRPLLGIRGHRRCRSAARYLVHPAFTNMCKQFGCTMYTVTYHLVQASSVVNDATLTRRV